MHAVCGVQHVFATLNFAVSNPCSVQHHQKAYVLLRHAASGPSMSLLGGMCNMLHKRDSESDSVQICRAQPWRNSDVDSVLRSRQGCALMPSSAQNAALQAGRAQPSRAELASQPCQVCRAQPSRALHAPSHCRAFPSPGL